MPLLVVLHGAPRIPRQVLELPDAGVEGIQVGGTVCTIHDANMDCPQHTNGYG